MNQESAEQIKIGILKFLAASPLGRDDLSVRDCGGLTEKALLKLTGAKQIVRKNVERTAGVRSQEKSPNPYYSTDTAEIVVAVEELCESGFVEKGLNKSGQHEKFRITSSGAREIGDTELAEAIDSETSVLDFQIQQGLLAISHQGRIELKYGVPREETAILVESIIHGVTLNDLSPEAQKVHAMLVEKTKIGK